MNVVKKFSGRSTKYTEADSNEPRPAGAEVVQPSISKIIKEAGFELAELKELFIIEEIKTFFEDKTLKQSLKIRLKSNMDVVDEYKAKVKEAIDKHSHSIDQGEIIDRTAFLKELGLTSNSAKGKVKK